MQKQKGKKTGKKAAAGDAAGKDEAAAAAAKPDGGSEDKPDNEPTEPEVEKEEQEQVAEMKTDEIKEEAAEKEKEDESATEPMPDAPTSPGPEASPGEVVRELPTRGLHARQPSLSVQSKRRSSSFRTSVSTTVSPVAGVKSPQALPPLAPDSEQVHEVFRRQAARVEELEKENKKLEKDLDDANSRRQKSENELEDLRESSVEVVELKDRLDKAEKQVAEMESLVYCLPPGSLLLSFFSDIMVFRGQRLLPYSDKTLFCNPKLTEQAPPVIRNHRSQSLYKNWNPSHLLLKPWNLKSRIYVPSSPQNQHQAMAIKAR